jgi:energy-coupling factor transporter ATP-binding protein EcfA2
MKDVELLRACEEVVGPSRASWMSGVVNKVVPGSRVMVLGSRRSGKTTVLRKIAELVGGAETHVVEAFAANVSDQMARLVVACAAPLHPGRHRLALVDDVECLTGNDVTTLRGLLRNHPRVSFLLTTSTVAGLQESLVAQCNVVELVMPRVEDLRALGGDGCVPKRGMSIGAALNQTKACELVGKRVRWRSWCEAPAIVAAVGCHGNGGVEANKQTNGPETNKQIAAAMAEVRRLLHDGWSCGDVIETLHNHLVDGEWDPPLDTSIAMVLLRFAGHADRPDMYTSLTYLLVLELIAL